VPWETEGTELAHHSLTKRASGSKTGTQLPYIVAGLEATVAELVGGHLEVLIRWPHEGAGLVATWKCWLGRHTDVVVIWAHGSSARLQCGKVG
jgi:branched-subunit amino acid transport protein